MKKRNWLKTTIAMLTLVATVLETGFTSVSTLAAEITTEDGIVVNNDAVEEADLNAGSGDELQIEVAPDNASDDEYVEETGSDDEDFAQEETFEEAEELKEGTLDVSDSGITGSGYDEISVYVNTEGLKKKDTFRIEFNGPSSASYNPVINDELDKTNDGRYDFEDLEGEDFSVRAYSSENVILSYRYNEDGYPEIVVESEETEKVLTTKTLTAKDDSEIEAISGEGYESVTVKFNTEELSDKAAFKLYVESDAAAKVNGEDATAGIEGLGKDTDSLTIEDLDEESFVAYVVSDKEDLKIKTAVKVDSVEDGVAVITVDNENVKRIYEYEDSKIKVTATLEKADAIPDDAYFDVTPLTDEEAEKYLEALNEGKDPEEDDPATPENTLLYNIGFYTDETKSEEIEPEEGSVSIAIEFKKDQLTEDIEAEADEEVVVTHIMEEGSEITTEEVDPQVSVENGTIDFDLESFSIVAITKVGTRVLNPGDSLSYRDVLKGAVNYGVVANEVELGGHIDSNFATGKLKAGCDTTQGAFTGDKAPGNTIVAKYDTSNGTGWYPYSSDGHSPFTVLTTPAAETIFNQNTNWRDYVTIDSKHNEQGLKDIVSALVSGTLSESLKTADPKNKLKNAVNDNKVIDLTGAGGGTYVIDFEPKDVGKYFESADSTKIKFNSNQFVVFNIPGDNINLKKFAVEIADKNKSDHSDTSNSSADIYCQHIVFNMPDAKKVNLDGVFGIFLAPKAEVTIGTTSTGWLVADKFKNGGEWHCVWQEMPKENEVKVNIPVNKKFINGAGKWEDGFYFKLEKMNVSGSAIDSTFPAQIINVNGNTSEDASGYFELPAKKGSQIDWENNGDWSYAGYSKYLGEWYKITEVDANGNEINDNNKPRADVEYNIIDPKKAYGENQNRQTEQPVYDNTKYWYVHVFYYLNPETQDIITVKRTARVNPTTNCYKGLPCEEDGVILFKNKYKPKLVTVQFEGIKKVNGSTGDVPDGKFGFTLYQYTGSNVFNTVVQANVSNVGSTVTFDPITLRPDGGWDDGHNVYYFLIEETRCDEPYEKDENVFVAKVTITRVGNDYSSSVEYYRYSPTQHDQLVPAARSGKTNFRFNASKFEFDNTYTASGEAVINGFKMLSGRKINPTDEFTFTLSSTDDKQANANQTKTFSSEVATNTGFAFAFDKLTYSLADAGKTYHYKVKEDRCSDEHVVCDTTEYNVTISIADDKSGELVVTQDKGKAADPLSFTNTYNASGNIFFKAHKIYATNSELSRQKMFKFKLDGGKVGGAAITPQEESVLGEGTAIFSTITFKDLNDVGKYKFTIREDIPDGAVEYNNDPTKKIFEGIIYDARIYYVTVNVYDNESGVLQKDVYGNYGSEPEETEEYRVSVDSQGNPEVNPGFTNDYKHTDISAPIGGDKILHGKELERGEFTFNLAPFDEATTKAVEETKTVVLPATSVQNGVPETLGVKEFKFDSITFKAAGTYKFLITEAVTDEEREANKNTVYSTDRYITTIVVDDNNSGALEVTSNTTVKEGGTGNVDIKFINTKYNPGEIPLFAYKDLSGRTLAEGQFTFYLRDKNAPADAAPLQTKTNKANGEVTFDNLHYEYKDLRFDENGQQVFTYTIEEAIPSDAVEQDDGTWKKDGYTYDGHVEEVNVTVTADVDEQGKRTGTLTVKADNAVKAANSTDEADHDVWFRNAYDASGKTSFGGTKRITGREFKEEDNGLLKAQLYTITGCKYENGALVGGTLSTEPVQTVDITKPTGLFAGDGGEFQFDEITYTEPGNYFYRVKETGTIPGVTNTTDVYDVMVTVTDNGDGTLGAANTFINGPINFVNTFDAENSVVLKAKKKVTGTDLEGKVFEFELKDATGNVIQTVENDGQNITFDAIQYYQNATRQDVDSSPFVYTINEKIKTRKGWTLSSAVYTVKVFLELDGDKINVDEHYYKPDAASESGLTEVDAADVVFENIYDAEGSVEVWAYKNLEGRDLEEGQFKFVLKDKAGNVVGNASNVAAKDSADAIAKFPVITYDENDLKASDTYKVGENKYIKYYTIEEMIPDGAEDLGDGFWKKDGYTYDGRGYNVIVTLEDKGDGEIETSWVAFREGTVKPDEDKFFEKLWKGFKSLFGAVDENKYALFTNKYEAQGKLRLGAVKKLVATVDGANEEVLEPAEDQFTFILTGQKENGETFTDSKEIKKLENDRYGVNFDEITFTKKGNYEYKLYELHKGETIDGITYDAHEYTVTVNVTDPGTGLLKVDASIDCNPAVSASSEEVRDEDGKLISYTDCVVEPVEVEFKNVLDFTPTNITIPGTKELTGRNLEDGEFWFVMENDTEKGNNKAYKQAVKNTGTAFSFPKIDYTRDDLKVVDNDGKISYKDNETFAYVIREITPKNLSQYSNLLPAETTIALDGMTYDTHDVHVTVKVTNNNGQLSAQILDTSDKVAFDNTYDAEGNVVFKVRKTSEKAKKDKETKFWFELKDVTGAKIKVPASNTAGFELKDSLVTYAQVNGAVGTFDSIKYERKDLDPADGGKYEKTFNYTVKEISGESTAYGLTEDYYKIAVKVTNYDQNGVIDKTGKLYRSWTITPVVGGVDGEPLDTDEIEMVFENPYNAKGSVEFPGKKEVIGTLPEGTVFTFELTQKDASGAYTSTIAPALKNKLDENNNVLISNGNPKTLTEGEFNYYIEYTQDDINNTYYYKVDETVETADPAIVYDPATYFIKVEIKDGATPGTLDVQKSIRKSVDGTATDFDKCPATAVATTCLFSNTVVQPNSVIFTAKKTLEGKALGDKMFTFEVKDSKGDVVVDENGKALRETNNDGGEVTFAPIKYELKDIGTHEYTITERADLLPKNIKQVEEKESGYLITHNVKVKVEQNGTGLDITTSLDGGEFKALGEGGYIADPAKFKNKYSDEVKVKFGGLKNLVGFENKDISGKFAFALYDESNKIVEIDGKKQIAYVDLKDKDLSFLFDEIKYDQDVFKVNGQFDPNKTEVVKKFTLKEVKQGEDPNVEITNVPNVTYSTQTYHINVTLGYDSEGLMTATVTTDEKVGTVDTDAKRLTVLTGLGFTNVADADIIIDGVKTVTGKSLGADGTYTFELQDEAGNVIRVDGDGRIVTTGGTEQRVTNVGNAFTFLPIKYSASDAGNTYTYIVKETASTDGTVIDSTEHRVVVTVSQEADGTIKATKMIEGDEISFNNTFSAEGETSLEVTKVLKNKPLKTGDFKFTLKNEKGEILSTITNGDAKLVKTKDGYEATSVAKFENIPEFKFTQESFKDANGNYLLNEEIKKYYTVEESYGNKTKAMGYTLEDTVYVVEITAKLTDQPIEGKAGVYKIDVTKKYAYKDAPVDTQTGLAAFIAKLTGNGTNAPEIIKFTNDYEAVCVIDPPVLTKQIMGREIKRGMFEFFVDSKDGLVSMKEFDKSVDKREVYYADAAGNLVKTESAVGYHRQVKNGYTVSGKETSKPGEISVDDLKYHFTDLIVFDDADIDLDTGDVSKTFVYTAVENKKVKVPGVENTPAVFTLTVTVYDKGDGVLHTIPEKVEEMKWVQMTKNALTDEQYSNTFLNLFNQEGSINLVGTKKMKGRKLSKDDKFEFILTDEATGDHVSVNNTILKGSDEPSVIEFKAKRDKNDGPGVVVADFLNYRYGAFEKVPGAVPAEFEEVDETGLHTYTIVEKFFEDDGIKCDTSTFRIYVDVQPTVNGNGEPVVDEQGHGQLDVKVTKVEQIFSDNNVGKFEFAPGSYFEFVNTFKAEGKIDFPGKKYLKDQAGNDIVSPDALEDEYEFALYSYSDAARKHDKTLVDVVKTDKDGNFKLDVPKYTEEVMKNEKGEYVDTKTLYYRLIETKPANGTWTENNTIFESDGVIYDNTEYDIDVNIAFERDAQGYLTGKLLPVAEIKKADTGEAIKNISFTNIVKEYVSVEGQKHWIDKETDPSKRPDVLLRLYSSAVDNGKTEINRYTIKAPDTTYRFFTDAKGNKLPATDSKGRAITYTVKEDVIRGYLSEQVGYDFYNTQGDILIRKIDADTEDPLSGAVLAILDGTTEIERWTSGASAHVVEKALTPGKTYTLHEVSAPEGYGLAADVTFTVPTDGSSITVTMSDPPIIGSVRLIKRDADTRAELAGAEFALYTESGARIYATGTTGSYSATSSTSNGVFVTDASGALTIADLPYGTYYFVETKAPEGYALSTERLGFTILRGGELVEVTFTDPKAVGSVRLSKVGTSGRALSGAVFELYAATPRTIGQAASSTIFTDAYYRYGTYRTNAAGELYVGDLPWDDYYFIEVEAPDGYEIATDVNGDQLVYTFTVSAASADATIDLGGIVNNPTTPPPPGPTPTPGVLGERVKKGGVVNGVLGVRAKPTSGVLGERIGPVTGDASNIILWLLLFTACVATIIATVVTGRKKKTAR